MAFFEIHGIEKTRYFVSFSMYEDVLHIIAAFINGRREI